MVKEMQKSVAGFKLPGMESVDITMISDADDLTAIGIEEARQ
jgi:hypothetical protein